MITWLISPLRACGHLKKPLDRLPREVSISKTGFLRDFDETHCILATVQILALKPVYLFFTLEEGYLRMTVICYRPDNNLW